MKKLITVCISIISFAVSLTACTKHNEELTTANNQNNKINRDTINSSQMKITISIGEAVFTATLYDNAAAKSFIELLPLTIEMSDLNANEKFYYFSTALPVNASDPGTIQAGDLMLYGNDCLVLFYKTFNTSYAYTKLGYVNEISGLVRALEKDTITIKFERQ